jgi:uncharacterized repeat protein (TIGR03806 family)
MISARSWSKLGGAALATALAAASTAASATTCNFPGEPGGAASISLQRAATGFTKPVVIAFSPERGDVYYVVEQTGLIKAVVGGVVQATPVLDYRRVVDASGNEMGLLGMAFHPDFASNRRVFLNYTASNPLRSRVVELRMGSDGRLDPASARMLLEQRQPYENHNGGNLAFGPDGYLYIGFGDGGSANDPQRNGQNLGVWLGKMLRIDVDAQTTTTPYGIPTDNPFVGRAGAKPEIYAYGLRNPWRYSFDSVTGELWVGDVGQDAIEEIDVVQKGENYGWSEMEGDSCFRQRDCNRSLYAGPVHTYPHSDGVSITGGIVYRGQANPALIGTYLYTDYASGKIWGLRRQDDGTYANTLLLDSGRNIVTFAQDADGEVYVSDHSGGVIYKVVPPASAPVGNFPRTVSATGCFNSTSPLVPADGVTPYDVKSQLWSDGLLKDRYIFVPGGRKIGFSASAPWSFPEGTVLVKNFFLPRRGADGRDARQIIETRFLVKRDGLFKGYSYKWDDQQRDGVLLGGATYRDVQIRTATGEEAFSYYYPSSSDCQRCHVTAGGGALGVDTGHMNYDVRTPAGTTVNQIDRLASLGVIDAATVPDDVGAIGSLVDPADTTASLNDRARSYLHTQCSHCHNRDFGTGQGDFDLRVNVPLAQTRLCDVAPTQGDLGVPGVKLLKPGRPDLSLVYLRSHTLDRSKRMPPIATSRLDTVGTDVLQRWIASLASCAR